VNVEVARHGDLDLFKELAELRGAVAAIALADNPPVAISRAANRDVVPYRV
jgi:hypothetical protein